MGVLAERVKDLTRISKPQEYPKICAVAGIIENLANYLDAEAQQYKALSDRLSEGGCVTAEQIRALADTAKTTSGGYERLARFCEELNNDLKTTAVDYSGNASHLKEIAQGLGMVADRVEEFEKAAPTKTYFPIRF